jgi:hypothetical protein
MVISLLLTPGLEKNHCVGLMVISLLLTPGLEKNHCVGLMVISPAVQSRAEKKPLRWLNGYFASSPILGWKKTRFYRIWYVKSSRIRQENTC